MQQLKQNISLLLKRPVFDKTPTLDPLFEQTMALNVQIHRQLYPEYDQFLKNKVCSILPPIFLPILKNLNLTWPENKTYNVITSSGTSGRPLRIPLDEYSLNNRIQIIKKIYTSMGYDDIFEEVFCFLIDPKTSSMAGSLVIVKALETYNHCKKIHLISKLGPAGLEFDKQALMTLFTKKFDKPVLIIGYPAMISHSIELAKKDGFPFKQLPDKSAILTGGGWKSFLPGVSVFPDSFQKMAGEFFSVPQINIRDMFGLSESPVVFVECENRGFHVPSFCKVEVIDPLQQTLMPEGEIGLMKITSPFTTSFPLGCILTTDKVSLHSSCKCGRTSDYFIPHGRSSAAKFETCAMQIGKKIEDRK